MSTPSPVVSTSVIPALVTPGVTTSAPAPAVAPVVKASTAVAPTIVDIGTVAAQNIVSRLKLDAGKVEADVVKVVDVVKTAIRDEISAMSSHFTLAVHDVQTEYEATVAKIKADADKAVADIRSGFSYVKANKGKISAVVAALAGAAGFVGHFL